LYDEISKYEKWQVEQWDSAQVTDQEFKYLSDTYGLDRDESQIVFVKYVLALRYNILDAMEKKYK
jgi:hypothetical protein